MRLLAELALPEVVDFPAVRQSHDFARRQSRLGVAQAVAQDGFVGDPVTDGPG